MELLTFTKLTQNFFHLNKDKNLLLPTDVKEGMIEYIRDTYDFLFTFSQILERGFKGFSNMTDMEIAQEFTSVFIGNCKGKITEEDIFEVPFEFSAGSFLVLLTKGVK